MRPGSLLGTHRVPHGGPGSGPLSPVGLGQQQHGGAQGSRAPVGLGAGPARPAAAAAAEWSGPCDSGTVITEPVTTEAVITELVTTETVITVLVITEAVITELVTTEPVITEQVITEPVSHH